jgi:hypothetical protein
MAPGKKYSFYESTHAVGTPALQFVLLAVIGKYSSTNLNREMK